MENSVSSFVYKIFVKNLFFQFDPELVHTSVIKMGEFMGKSSHIKAFLSKSYTNYSPFLKQKVAGIEFKNPIGLAAGFDYEARLTQILPSLGFGFQTVGTITNNAYEGNSKPRLGRLIKSKSLMVYKGFKNEGIKVVSDKLKKQKFEIPTGLSIGKTNSKNDKMTQEDAVLDIVSAFKTAENTNLRISYYELNISCPNLFGNVSFYPLKNLYNLLSEVTSLKLKKPIFIKMPISETNKQVLEMLDVITKFPVAGVILGNTQNNRKDKSFVKEEVEKYKYGNFSGKPTFERSNELIKLAYKNYGKKLIIIGCGGVFNANDAYKKIKLGASLVQLITGLVYEGPFLVSQINKDLITLLKSDGFKNVSDAVGIEA